jgi:hypothetical protein
MSSMTNPHGLNLSPPMISAHSTTNASFSQNTNSNYDDDDSNYNNEILTMDLITNSTNDPNDPRFSYLDQDDAVLLSIGFSNHSLVLNYIQQYSSSRGFLATHHTKDCFLADEYEKNFLLDKAILGQQKIQILTQHEEVSFIVPPNPMVAPSMNLVVLRLTICGVQRRIVLFSAIKLQTFPTTIHSPLYLLWLTVEQLLKLKVP